jgi:oligopeptide/dipeptide ABC transporter ATP-binding protein
MNDSMLDIRDLGVTFDLRRGRRRGKVHAVRSVSLRVGRGRTLGVVGESGSGKTTLARAVLGLTPPTAGTVLVDGIEVGDAKRAADLRRRMQVVFQNPTAALDPLRTVGEAIEEPLRVHTDANSAARAERVAELLDLVGLDTSLADRLPRHLSGGQRQRVNIARAMAVEPQLLILDEPISALDLSTQGQILNLLEELQARSGAAYLFIAHDLAAVYHASHELAVMYLGQIVEHGDAEAVYHDPQHPYTQALIAAAPVADPALQAARRSRRKRLVHGELPSPLDPPPGCSFHPRCAEAMERCRVEAPPAYVLTDGRLVACHLVEEVAVDIRGPRTDERVGEGLAG